MSDHIVPEFWFNNFKVLYENDNYILFFPQAGTSKIEQLNAIARFSIYLFVLLLLCGDPQNTLWLYLPIFMLVSTIVLWKLMDKEIIAKDVQDTSQHLDIDPTQNKVLGLLSDTKNAQSSTSACKKPTESNPFMNSLPYDYEEDTDLAACSFEDPNVIQKSKDEFNKNLYRDANDLYEKANSQRTYYSMPSTTIANDQKGFAEWCYGVPETCKTKQTKCLVFDDLRYSRRESPSEYVI